MCENFLTRVFELANGKRNSESNHTNRFLWTPKWISILFTHFLPPCKKFSPIWFCLTGNEPNVISARSFLSPLLCVLCWLLPPPSEGVRYFYIWLFCFYWLSLYLTRSSIIICRPVLKIPIVSLQSKKFFTFCIFRIYVFRCVGFCSSRVN
jgi:hypothetical protein